MFNSFDSSDSSTQYTTLPHNPIKQKLKEVENLIADFVATYEKLSYVLKKESILNMRTVMR